MTSLLRTVAPKALIISLLASGLLIAVPIAASAAPADDAAFTSLYKAEWKWRKSLNDEDEDTPPDRVRSRYPDVSKTAQEAKLKHWDGVLADLAKIDPASLSPEQQVNYTVYKNQIETLANRLRFRDYEMAFGFWSAASWGSRRTLRTEEDYRNYIAQLNDVPRYFDQNLEGSRIHAVFDL
jgi:uncharacterized protein (DUF885 family)